MNYRDGVMAERQRTILVALQGVQEDGSPCEAAHAVAHQISRAGKELAVPVEEWNTEFSVFGERRFLLGHPTFLEGRESPFTHEGRLRLEHLERLVAILRKRHSPGAFDMAIERVLRASDLEDEVFELHQAKEALLLQNTELHETVASLAKQLKGEVG